MSLQSISFSTALHMLLNLYMGGGVKRWGKESGREDSGRDDSGRDDSGRVRIVVSEERGGVRREEE